MVKHAPSPLRPSTCTQPLWRSTISFTTDKPMPRPPLSRVRPASARQKRGEHHLRLVGREADARVLHADGRHDVAALHAHGNQAPFGRVTNRVRDEVGGCLANHVRVAQHAHALLHLVLQREPESATNASCVATMPAISSPTLTTSFFMGVERLSKRESFKMAFYQAAEALHLGVHGFQALLVGLEHAVHHRFHGGLDGHQRRTQLMCHVGGQTALQLAVALDGVGHRIERLAQVRDLVPRRAARCGPTGRLP